MPKRDVHVVPHKGDWAVRREGADRVSSVHPTQGRAEDAGRGIARREHVEVVVHIPDGRIRDSDSYGHDPLPPRDKKH